MPETYSLLNRLDVAENELANALEGKFDTVWIIPNIQNALEELKKIRQMITGKES